MQDNKASSSVVLADVNSFADMRDLAGTIDPRSDDISLVGRAN
jgi:hypothetical protein